MEMRREFGQQSADCLEFACCCEVVGPIVKADEQTSLRLLEHELRATAVLCDDVSDHLGVGGDNRLVGHGWILVAYYRKNIASFLERE
jgi:hypothetical protein